MSSSTKKIQAAPILKQMQVFGWIRNKCTETKIQILPIAISYIIFAYFYIQEALKLKYTNNYNNHPCGCIIDDKEFITKKNEFKWFTVWGDKLIDPNLRKKYIWHLTFKSYISPEIAIGISSKMKPELEKSLPDNIFYPTTRHSQKFKNHYYYCVTSTGGKIRKEGGEREEEQAYYGWNGLKVKWQPITKLQMTLDCTKIKKKLMFVINDDHHKYFNFNNIKFRGNIYTLCVSFKLFSLKSFELENFMEIDVKG